MYLVPKEEMLIEPFQYERFDTIHYIENVGGKEFEISRRRW